MNRPYDTLIDGRLGECGMTLNQMNM